MIGIDADYSMSRAYQSRSWPRFVVVDPEGIVRFHAFPGDRNLTGLRKCLRELLDKSPGGPVEKPELDRGIAFPAAVLACRRAPRDRSPRLAFDRAGNPNVVYYSNRAGTNAVFLRRFDSKGESQEIQLSPPAAECYAADCVFDSDGTLWVVWCEKRSGLYDIFIQQRREGHEPKTEQLTSSLEDAMSPRIAAGPSGLLTVTYYKWHSLHGVSRDRDVFARTFDPSARSWGPEVEVSPHDPEVEDHTDPQVVIDKQHDAWIVWSYDYHPQLFRKPVDAAQPTIFAARVGANGVSSPLLVGATGRFRNAIDLFPSVALDEEGTLWCAWDCSEPRRCIRLARLSRDPDQFESATSFGRSDQTCSTPELSAATNNCLLLAWSQRAHEQFRESKVVLLRAGRPVAEATLTEKADVLFPQARQSPTGEYWVTYERSDATGSRIVLRNITQTLSHGSPPQGEIRGRR